MNIGFDLDGIFIQLPPFMPAWIIERLYRVKDTKKLTYRMPGKFEQLIRQFSHNSFFRPKNITNIAFLEKLSKKNNSLYLITSRFGFLRQSTEKLLRLYHLNSLFEKIYCNYNDEQPHLFKDRIIKEKDIRIFVDDDVYLLDYLTKHNPKVKFYWFNVKEQKKMGKNLFAVTSLDQIFE